MLFFSSNYLFRRTIHQAYRKRLPDFVTSGNNPPIWTFKPADIFESLDAFMLRLNDLKDIFELANEFSKLERVEIGGINGKNINRNILKVMLV